LFFRPASSNAQFMRPVTTNRFPTPVVIESDANVNVLTFHNQQQRFK